MNETAAPFDRVAQRHFSERARRQAGSQESSVDFLYQAASEDVALRLNATLRDFPVAVDLTAHSGTLTRMLAKRSDLEGKAGPQSAAKIAHVISCARSTKLLPWKTSPHPDQGMNCTPLICDDEALPFASESLDLVTSVLGLQWVNDLPGALVQIRRALKPDGLFIAALVGGDSLTELRQSLLAAEAELTGGAHARVSPFADLRDMGTLLQRSGFALPVVDVETLNVRYANPARLLDDLRAMGAQNALRARSRKVLRRDVLMRAMEIYTHRFSDSDGRVRARFDILHLSGWAPHESQQKPLKPGSAKMRLADALGTVEKSTGDKAGH